MLNTQDYVLNTAFLFHKNASRFEISAGRFGTALWASCQERSSDISFGTFCLGQKMPLEIENVLQNREANLLISSGNFSVKN